MGKIKKIGVLTSGGDSPGMNAAIRAVVRAGIFNGLEVYGIRHGYKGLVNNHIKRLKSYSVSNIIQRGGTILKTARCKDFLTKEGRKQAYNNIKENELDAIIVIGGDGTFTGATVFAKEYNIPIIGLPGTIDNDLYGTDFTIGYDTALNTVIEAVDKIRDTASAHNRLFFVEVMGRDAGFIALRSAISCGAEAVLIPEIETHAEDLLDYLEDGFTRKKSSGIIAEGDQSGGAFEIAKKIEKDFINYDVRVTILGHIQRGGSPTAFDRVTASTLGVAAVKALLGGEKNIMVGLQNNSVAYVPLEKAIKHHKTIKKSLLDLVKVLNI